MKRTEKIIKNIKEDLFKDHVATLTKHGELEVLDWSNPNSFTYAVRYVFDGYNMYISGELGEAVFNLPWKATIDSFEKDMNVGYFASKMSVGEKYKWDAYEAEKDLLEWKEEYLHDNRDIEDDELEEFNTLIDDLINSAYNCRNAEQWAWQYVNGIYESDIRKYDCDYWEWIYDIGNVVSEYVYAYLIGLQMVAEQLKER